MNKEQYKKECHVYLDELLNNLDLNKKIMGEILSTFDKICEKHNISYCLGYGSLLGAIRDGESIPWDFDTDVLVSIDDAKSLYNFLKNELPDNYLIDSNFNNNGYYYETTIKDKNDKSGLTHLDIFYMIGCPKGNISRVYKLSKYIKLEFYRRLDHYSFLKTQQGKNIIKKVLRHIKHINKSSYLLNVIHLHKFNKIIHKYSYSNSEYSIIICGNEDVIPKPILNNQKITFEGSLCQIPSNYDDILCHLYKDWKTYIPIANRFDSFYYLSKIYLQANNKFKNINYRRF